MTKYIIVWGVYGMNSISHEVGEWADKEAAVKDAYCAAREEREGLDGIHGYVSCDEVDEEEYNEEVENDITYMAYTWSEEREKECEIGLNPHDMPDWD